MEITQVKIHKIDREDSKLKAYVNVTLDDSFAVHNIRIIEGDNKLFVAMPSRKIGDEGYQDIVHPTNQATRKMFEDVILNEYNKME